MSIAFAARHLEVDFHTAAVIDHDRLRYQVARGFIGVGSSGPEDIDHVVDLLHARGIKLRGEHVALVTGIADNKVRVPETPDLYHPLVGHGRVARIVALSGGYPLAEACRRLAQNHGMIASLSRALIGDLRRPMDGAAFDAALAEAVSAIYKASAIEV